MTFLIDVECKNDDGSLMDLTGLGAEFALKLSPDDPDPALLELQVGNGITIENQVTNTGHLTVKIPPTATDTLATGWRYFDVIVVDGADRYPIVEEERIEVRNAVNWLGGAPVPIPITTSMFGHYVRKGTAGSIAAGVPVYLTGWTSGYLLVEAAIHGTTADAIGVTNAAISDVTSGYAVVVGEVTVSTVGMSIGQRVFLGSSALTTTRSPGRQELGRVASVGASGCVVVEVGDGDIMKRVTPGTWAQTSLQSTDPGAPLIGDIWPRDNNSLALRGTDAVTRYAMFRQFQVYADWDPTLCRYWLVDYDGGSDSNIGYVDAVAGSTIDPTGKAVKTLERLREIMPTYGNGLRSVILIKPRAAFANYLMKDGITQDDLDLRKYVNYQPLLVRGSSDLTNTAADRVNCGFLTAYAGPGGAGEFTVGVGSTTSNIVVASALPTEDAAGQSAISFFRVRFLTGALAGTCAWIHSNDAGNIVPGNNTASAPANGDTFLIERPGVRVANYWDCLHARTAKRDSPVNTFNRAWTVGIGVTGTVTGTIQLAGGGADATLCGFEGTSSTAAIVNIAGTGVVQFDGSYRDEGGTLRVVGMGLRWAGTSFLDCVQVQSFFTAFTRTSAAQSFVATRFNIGGTTGPSYFGRAPSMVQSLGIGPSASSSSVNVNVFGRLLAVPTIRQTRVYVDGVPIDIRTNMRVTGVIASGATSAVFRIMGTASAVVFEDVSGSGNTNYVLNMDDATDCDVSWGQAAANAITATLGDITSSGSGVATFAQLAHTGWIDKRGNKLVGTGQIECAQGIAVVASGAIALGAPVRVTASNTVAAAQANNAANATDVIGCAQNAAVDGANLMVIPNGVGLMAFASTPTVPPVVAYLSEATAGIAAMVKPVTSGTNQQLRLGSVIRPISGQNLAVADIRPEMVPVLA